MAVPGRTVDRYTGIHQPLAEFEDIFHLVREVSEISSAVIGFGIPVPSEFHLGLGVVGGAQEDQGKTASFHIDAANFLKAELVAVEIQGGVEVRDPNHCMEKSHPESLVNFGVAG